MRTIWPVVLVIALTASATAQERAGRFVMLKDENALMFTSERSSAHHELEQCLFRHRVLRVTKTHRRTLEIEGSGCIAKSDAISIDKALAYWSQKISEDPNAADPYVQRAIAYEHLGMQELSKRAGNGSRTVAMPPELNAAIDDIGMAIRIERDNAAWWVLLGSMRLSRGETALAYEDFTEVIRLQPKWNCGYRCRGKVWFDRREFDRAIADFTKVIELAPASADGYVCRAIAKLNNNDYTNAILDCDKAIDLEPENSSCYCARASARQQLKKYDLAIADWNQAIALNETNYLAIANLAMLLATCPVERHRDGGQAVVHALALAAAFDQWQSREVLAAAYAEAGDFENAVKEQTKSLAMQRAGKDADPESLALSERCLQLFQSKKPYRVEELSLRAGPSTP